MKRAERKRTVEDVQASTASAVKATTNAAYAQSTTDDLYDGFTPEEIVRIQELDRLAYQKPKRSLFKRVKESAEVRRHRKKIHTTNDRIIGKY